MASPLDLVHYEGNLLDRIKTLEDRLEALERTELSGVAGPTGPTGATGPQGDEGPTGPPGELSASGDYNITGDWTFANPLGIGTLTPRGQFDVDGGGDIWLVDDGLQAGADTIYIPGHIFVVPYGATNVCYLQARRSNDSGSTEWMIRVWNAGSYVDAIRVLSDGKVGILKSTPTRALDVTGAIGASQDMYPKGDNAGLLQRLVDIWINPATHFTSFSGWTWATDAGIFAGAPSSIDVASYPSLAVITHSNTTDSHFAYKSGNPQNLLCRLCKGVDSYVGIRIDDGTNDNFVELRLENGTTGGFQKVVRYYQTGGAGALSNTCIDNLIPAFWILKLGRSATTGTWTAYMYVTRDSPVPIYVGGAVSSLTWTVARYGITFGQRAYTGFDRAGIFDWFNP